MMMTTREFLAGMGAAALGLCTAAPPVLAQVSTRALIRWAELDIDPAKLDSFKAAAIALKEAVLRMEPGVAAYHAVSEADNPGRVHVFEMYDDAEAYQAHVRQTHFQDFRTTTETMVASRRLYDTVAIKLGAKARLTASPLVRIAELEIDPAQLRAYEAAVSEEIGESIRSEPGVLTIYAVALADQRSHLRFFEIYADEAAYRQHLESPHFKKYVQVTQPMIRARKLSEARPVFLGLRKR
jgi:quinol monooxygenase YgiN